MSMKSDTKAAELRMDVAELYREETFTDRKVGTIRRMTPVKADGSTDERRAIYYVGQAQLLTPMGPVPLSFDIDASSLKEAVEKFTEAAKQAVEQTMEEVKELRREAASSIVVPQVGAMPPRGGKIQLP